MTSPTDDPMEDFIEDTDVHPNLVLPPMNVASGRQHQMWSDRLRNGFGSTTSVRLPAGYRETAGGVQMRAPMHVIGDDNIAKIFLRAEAIQSNMQTNAAAFEGWALALKRWAGAERVGLFWTVPDASDGKARRHFERFLYRAQRFAELFPDWFWLDGDTSGATAIRSDASLFLNVAGDRTHLADITVCAPGAWADEREMECYLRQDRSFAEHFDFGPKFRTDQQFPVGLFSEPSPTEASKIFPGGKGAIDLVCADADRFWLFELKAGANIPMGTVSELIFYASVMRDAARGHFRFANHSAAGSDVTGADVSKAKEIIAVMLGDRLHPLLKDAALMAMLNSAVEATWNRDCPVSVQFRAATFEAGKITDVAA